MNRPAIVITWQKFNEAVDALCDDGYELGLATDTVRIVLDVLGVDIPDTGDDEVD